MNPDHEEPVQESIEDEDEDDDSEEFDGKDYSDQPQMVYDKFTGVVYDNNMDDKDSEMSDKNIESDQYETADYEKLVSVTYEKAKKYKRKSK